MRIEDNFLDQDKFNELQNFFMGDSLPWFYWPRIDSQDDVDKYQFYHSFYNNNNAISSFINILNPILDVLKLVSIWRIKANLLTRTSDIIENSFHVDMGLSQDVPFPEEKLNQWTTSIFYLNTNNGYTKFEDGTKINSIANRMVTFPANMKHTGTSCTDEKIRVVINFNYFK